MKNTTETYELLKKLGKEYHAKAGQFKKLKHVRPETLEILMTTVWKGTLLEVDREKNRVYNQGIWWKFDRLLKNARSIKEIGYGCPPKFIEDIKTTLEVDVSGDEDEVIEVLEIGKRLCSYLQLVHFWSGDDLAQDVKNTLGPTIIDLARKIRANVDG